jgi:hypothetical protein
LLDSAFPIDILIIIISHLPSSFHQIYLLLFYLYKPDYSQVKLKNDEKPLLIGDVSLLLQNKKAKAIAAFTFLHSSKFTHLNT